MDIVHARWVWSRDLACGDIMQAKRGLRLKKKATECRAREDGPRGSSKGVRSPDDFKPLAHMSDDTRLIPDIVHIKFAAAVLYGFACCMQAAIGVVAAASIPAESAAPSSIQGKTTCSIQQVEISVVHSVICS